MLAIIATLGKNHQNQFQFSCDVHISSKIYGATYVIILVKYNKYLEENWLATENYYDLATFIESLPHPRFFTDWQCSQQI